MKFLCALCVFCGVVVPALAIDREAFTFTNYDLQVRVEPEQQRLAVRGRISLRNDAASPQKIVTLQISSTLDWRSIKIAGKPADFSSHAYASDIDHTGALSEAIVSLPQEIAARGTLEMEIGYEGVVPLDATRLTRIGAPEEKAKHIDWDQISKSFTAVRGIGYVVWYPVSTEAASLSDGDSVPEAIGRWNARQIDSTMGLRFESSLKQTIFFSGTPNSAGTHSEASTNEAAFSMAHPAAGAPTFVIADYQKLTPQPSVDVRYLAGQEEAADAYAEVAGGIDLAVPVVGGGSGDLRILGLPDPYASSFVTEGMLLSALTLPITNDAELSIAYAEARQKISSPRTWIQEGIAHYAQALFIEGQQGRQAALNYLNAHVGALVATEKQVANDPKGSSRAARSLIHAPDDVNLQAKAMYVWWMLRDMVGDAALKNALAAYRPEDDRQTAYMQRLIEKASHRDLEWFFDDWVYRDGGLPDFRVASVYPRELVTGGYMVTVEIENLGDAGAEVPFTLRNSGGDITKRLEVHAKSKASIRIESPTIPSEVVVNDGSVPESDTTNNSFKIEAH
jgi:hypothetical protein